MKEQILELRAQGKTYNEIKEILGCSKSTISFHCGEGQKEKAYSRNNKNRKKKAGIIKSKLEKFTRYKIKNFRRGTWGEPNDSTFNYTSAYELIDSAKNCYLSGRPLDLENSRSYHLDHIIPQSKGGKNTLKNLGVACKEANMAKSDMLVDDFIQLCVDVCKNNGYIIMPMCHQSE